MGKYFLMSYHFNKNSAVDFGLNSIDEDTAIDLSDNSLWKKSNLYDFGWGQENGYIKLPLPDKELLFEIALHSTSKDDVYGAAAVIFQDYSDELLNLCEDLILSCNNNAELKRLIDIFHLAMPVNRSKTLGKDFSQIYSDFSRWKSLSERIKDMKNKNQGKTGDGSMS